MPEPVILTYTYTEDEYTSAARLFYGRTIHTRFHLFLSLAVLLGSIVGIILTGESIVWVTLMFAAFFLLMLSAYAHFVIPRQQYRRNPKFRDEYNLRFSEEGMVFHSKGVESRLEWNFYSKVWETPEFYFLLYGKDMFTVIPKRAFAGRKQEAIFRDLLRRKISPDFETHNLKGNKPDELEDEYVPRQGPPDWR